MPQNPVCLCRASAPEASTEQGDDEVDDCPEPGSSADGVCRIIENAAGFMYDAHRPDADLVLGAFPASRACRALNRTFDANGFFAATATQSRHDLSVLRAVVSTRLTRHGHSQPWNNDFCAALAAVLISIRVFGLTALTGHGRISVPGAHIRRPGK